ncbi:protease modulator HflC [bacterium]|jgi:modulator of FtsH protease HflC|nr:protease modulator HflC [Verrucomicrobiota bacterium]MDA7647424.1 protease modulator HflC [Akkermansiaceae bacterium]MDC0299003.1 protease modulator HflC [bacterium]MBT6398774.1 protease modulator HflC [Verrucomicrobiota bacterium]MBT7214485.1 protease modulator HflC [Verrucomicrobiota bacterium]
MKKVFGFITAVLVLIVLLFVTGTVYTVREDQQVILTQFGKSIGDPITEAGLHFKLPFIVKVNVIEKRVLAWDGESAQMPTRDKTYIQVDTFARWEISEPLVYFKTLRDERSALSRLDDILGSETRNAVAKHDLLEVVRSTKDRKPEKTDLQTEQEAVFEPIKIGRREIENNVYEIAKTKLEDIGINLLDLRFKRINYNQSVAPQIYEQMISERQQIAERFRSEGAGEAARTMGKMEREVKRIESEAYRKIQSILGEADAESTRIYAEAYGGTPERESFYEFVKTLEAYDKILDENTTVILSTDSDLFKLLKGSKSE